MIPHRGEDSEVKRWLTITRDWLSIVSISGQRLWRWPNIETMLGQILFVFDLDRPLSEFASGWVLTCPLWWQSFSCSHLCWAFVEKIEFSGWVLLRIGSECGVGLSLDWEHDQTGEVCVRASVRDYLPCLSVCLPVSLPVCLAWFVCLVDIFCLSCLLWVFFIVFTILSVCRVCLDYLF